MTDDPAHPPQPDRLLRVAAWSTALAFGAMASSAYSLRKDEAGFSFDFTPGTVISFVVGAGVALFYWRVIGALQKTAPGAQGAQGNRRRPRIGILSAALFLAAVGLFLYPIKFVPPGKLKDVAVGLILAFLVLGLVAVVVIKLIRLLEEDERRTRDREQETRDNRDEPS